MPKKHCHSLSLYLPLNKLTLWNSQCTFSLLSPFLFSQSEHPGIWHTGLPYLLVCPVSQFTIWKCVTICWYPPLSWNLLFHGIPYAWNPILNLEYQFWLHISCLSSKTHFRCFLLCELSSKPHRLSAPSLCTSCASVL